LQKAVVADSRAWMGKRTVRGTVGRMFRRARPPLPAADTIPLDRLAPSQQEDTAASADTATTAFPTTAAAAAPSGASAGAGAPAETAGEGPGQVPQRRVSQGSQRRASIFKRASTVFKLGAGRSSARVGSTGGGSTGDGGSSGGFYVSCPIWC